MDDSQDGGIAIMPARPGARVTIFKHNPADTDAYSELHNRPDWSPMGDKIAISHQWNYDHTYADGEVISARTGADLGTSVPAYQAEFDPSGTWVAGFDYDYDAGDTVYKKNIVPGQRKHFRDDYRDMVWSPDGSMLALRCDANGDYQEDLCLMKADGTGIRMIKRGSAKLSITPRSWRNF